MHWEVSSTESGMRLIAFLLQKLDNQYSARHLKQLLEKNQCTVNDRVERFASTTVGTGDQIALSISNPLPKSSALSSPAQILYEDNELLIYNKPAGIACENEKFQFLKSGSYLALVHRLDRDTTGALIFAKSQDVFEKMVLLFKKRLINKEYLAIVDGVPKMNQGLIDNYIGEIHRYQGQKIWGEVKKQEGQQAITTWQCERKGSQSALVRCSPKTGRTHQIRVHLSSMGHPILGDFHYAKKFRCSYQAPRCMLHAWTLSFPHPTETKAIKIHAPLPDDFKKAIEQLFGHYEDINH